MSSEIHLARFGNRSSAHTLLAHTGDDIDLLGKIVWYTDAPPNSPEVVEPFASGYRLDDTYVVQLTKPDDTAARPGMVATTAALVPISLLTDLDLTALLARLARTEAGLGPPLAAPTLTAGPHPHPPGAGALVSAVLAGGRAAWLGPGLTDAIGCVWTHLSPTDRARVVFGAAFHPEGLSVPTGGTSIVVIAIPNRAAARWSDWPTLSADSAQPPDPARDALLGDDNGRGAALARDLDIGDTSVNQWRHLATAAQLAASVDKLDHEATRALLQLLGLLQPTSGKGGGPKRAALARLAEITPTAGFADIRGLRGIPWPSLPSAPGLADLLADWARTTFPDPLRGDDFADAAVETIAADSSDTFGQALASALQAAADQLALSPAAEAVLRHPRGSHAITWLVQNAGSRTIVDAALADAASATGTDPAWVAPAAAHHGLPRTHATAIDTSVPAAAWQAHLLVAPRTEAAEDILARRTGAAGTVRAALRLSDAALAERAGRLAAAQPALLRTGDIANEKFRAVWAAATRHGADPWRYASPADAAAPLLALAADDQPVDPTLLDAVSRTSAADLSRQPDRTRLWNRLPPEAAARFKAATAAALARGLRPGDPVPEAQLQRAILAPDVLGAVAHEDARQAVSLLRTLPSTRQEHAGFVARRARFAPGDAAELARLILDRRWTRAAETIVDLASSRPDLQAAAGQVGQLFSPLERLRRLIGISAGVRDIATADELRDALHDTARRLYPGGPTHDALWERAGGHDADVPDASTGRLRWGLALDAVARGQRGAPTLSALLNEMMTDYPNNSDLRILAKAFQERSSR